VAAPQYLDNAQVVLLQRPGLRAQQPRLAQDHGPHVLAVGVVLGEHGLQLLGVGGEAVRAGCEEVGAAGEGGVDLLPAACVCGG